MKIYLVYFYKPQFPRQVEKLLTRFKAEKYSDKSSTIKSEMSLDKIMWEFQSYVGKAGFMLMVDSTGIEHLYPEGDPTKLSRLDPDLDITVLRWKDEFVKSE